MPLNKIRPEEPIVQFKPQSFHSEKEIQVLFEQIPETLMGVRFIARSSQLQLAGVT